MLAFDNVRIARAISTINLAFIVIFLYKWYWIIDNSQFEIIWALLFINLSSIVLLLSCSIYIITTGKSIGRYSDIRLLSVHIQFITMVSLCIFSILFITHAQMVFLKWIPIVVFCGYVFIKMKDLF